MKQITPFRPRTRAAFNLAEVRSRMRLRSNSASAANTEKTAVPRASHVRKGDILCVVDSQDEVLKYAARFMQYYRENAKYLERTYGFVERIGIDRIRAIVVEDSEGTAARLDSAIDAYRDPWKEAYTAARPTEFATLLPVIQ